MTKFTCPCCGKTMASRAGLEKHLKASRLCRETHEGFKDIDKGGDGTKEKAKSRFQEEADSEEEEARPTYLEASKEAPPAKMQRVVVEYDVVLGNDCVDQDILHYLVQGHSIEKTLAKNLEQEETDLMDWLPYDDGCLDDESQDENLFDPYAATTTEEESEEEVLLEGVQVDENQVQEGNNVGASGKESGKQFKRYVRDAYQNFAQLQPKEKTAIRIMQKLIKKRATLDTYNDVMEWHLRESGQLQPQQSLGDSKSFITREKLMQKLRKRYNMDTKYAEPYSLVLPHTSSKIDVWRKLARDNVQSLLTDPRWTDKDWLYFNDNPFAPPPENCPYISDLNTGEAYISTYKELITKPNQILVAIPLYIDGAVTGQYDKLQVTALKMTIGILNRRARDKEFAWKTLGYVTNYTKEDSRGKKILVQLGHVAAHELYVDGMSDDEEGGIAEAESEVDKAADYHAILSVLLESLFQLIEEGMVVDIFYKGKMYSDCELVFFVPFVKCDGDEGDKLCCSYRSRGKDIKQLCRYCQCPNAETDNPDGNWPYKTEPMLKKLFEANNAQKLRDLSQICIKNAFHGLRFGLQNKRGIHGACPWELLHAILLGIFKYARDCFFAQMGETSSTAQEINALAQIIGRLFARQSDRSKPRTKFAKGILKGKLMAKEYTGVLLVMAAILQCQKGRELLKSARKKNFKTDWAIRDWVLLVETLLQWEAYLTLAQMDKKHVQRLKKKHRFLMFLLKKVGNRSKGMGFKVMKFHAIIHLAFDILMFGVPMVVDTGSNESHHKTTKVAAKLTQKDIKCFEKQTSHRCDDFHVLDLALEELHGRPLWHYFDGFEHDETPHKETIKRTGGMMMSVYWDTDTNEVAVKIITRMNNKKGLLIDTQFLEYAWQIQQKVAHLVPKMRICAEHSREGQMFRAHPNFRGKGPWKDWVMIQWEEGEYPAQIWGFLDLTDIDEGTQVLLDDGLRVGSGIFAIVESCTYIEEEEPASDLFKPLQLETNQLSDEGDVLRRMFYVVDVETFKQPIVVIPDIGSTPKCKYFMMSPRSSWAQDFQAWIEMPHHLDKTEMLSEPEEDEQGEAEEEDEDG